MPMVIAEVPSQSCPPHVRARNVEARRPSVVVHLPPRSENQVHRHVFDPRHVPREPHQRVEALARSYPHLLVRQGAEDQIGQRRAGRDIRGLDSSVLKVEEGQGIHAPKRNLHARYGENYKASRPRHAARSSGVAHSPSAPEPGERQATMTCSVVTMNATGPGAMKLPSSASARSHSGVVVAARSAAESSNQTMATPSQAGSRPRV